jgi:hypothetical protein
MVRIGSAYLGTLGALVFGVGLAAPLPASAQTQCLYFDVSYGIEINQYNGPHVNLDLEQTEGEFHGRAHAYTTGSANEHSGSAEGVVTGDALRFTIRWDDGTVGDYTGAITTYNDSDDRRGIPRTIELDGTTVDRTKSAAGAKWHGHTRYACLAEGAPPQSYFNLGVPTPPPPPKALGRTPAPAGAPPGPAMSICRRAADARARNSPLADQLEAQCNVATSPAKRRAPSPDLTPAPR